MRIVYPWFPAELTPNARVHWAKRARAAKNYRRAWFLLTRASRAEVHCEGKIPLTVVFNPPNRRPRDLDNCIAAIKSGMDGLADALSVNDRRFRPTYDISEDIFGTVHVLIGQTTKGES